ncbi:MAG: hypothetical protein Q9204_005288 [Flavoplaca sp. TL-2023a]
MASPMAGLDDEEPPTVPPRNPGVTAMNSNAQSGIGKEYFDQCLHELHNSLTLKFSEVERMLRENGPHDRRDNAQVSNKADDECVSILETRDADQSWWKELVETLSMLLDPFQKNSFPHFAVNPAREVQEKLDALHEEMDVLRVEKKDLEDDLATSSVHLAASRKETTDAKISNRKLLEQNSKYRSIITESGSDDIEVPDTKIHGQFVELRELIQRIVHRHYAGQCNRRLENLHNRWFDGQKRFRDDLKSLGSEALQQFLIRGKIFEFVNDYLLSARSFGIGRLEEELKDFEKALDKSRKGERSKWPGDTCKAIVDFMDPFLLTATIGSGASNEQLVRELCDKAYSLSVLMRRNKNATFQIPIMKHDTGVTKLVEDKVSCQYFDGPRKPDILGSRIAITIFGGLVKIPESSSDDRLTLEKSHVVCRTQ